MRLFGLTGGIASGKSAVAARFRARGVPVIDADQLARDVVAPGTPGLAAILEAFGPELLGADGALDRKALAARVFADAAERRRLNAIVHPLIAAATAEATARLEASGARIACYEAALIVENGVADAFRPLVVVSAPYEAQLARAMARDGASEEETRARLDAQAPLSAKLAAADHVIDNSGAREALVAAADSVLDEILRRAGLSPSAYAAV